MHFTMHQALGGLLLLLTLPNGAVAVTDEAQKIISNQLNRVRTNPTKLHGRFLHISDIHPDPFYERNASVAKPNVCHRGHGKSGLFGSETSDCDSPFELANATFKWIKENLKDKIDFVIWTGDNARHDNDIKHPRTEKAIYKLNEQMVDMMMDTFHKHDNEDDDDPTNDFVVPIVPTIGNNDIFPHNVFMPGPNSVTRTYLNMWKHFVPEEEHHIFERGAYFMLEVIPNRLAVFSLNTMYFFRSNGAVDGCKKRSEPGYAQFEWLRIQLQLIRERNMKAILIGHVPPAWTRGKKNWENSCWDKFAIWTHRYRDILVGSLFGHMNLDHFILTDTNGPIKRLEHPESPRRNKMFPDDDEVTIMSPESYLTDLREVFSHVTMPPKIKSQAESEIDSEDYNDDEDEEADGNDGLLAGLTRSLPSFLKLSTAAKGDKWGKRYTLSFVGPSVIPNFFPTLRVMEYNIEGLTDSQGQLLPPAALTPKAKQEIKETSKEMVQLQVLLRDIKRRYTPGHKRKSESSDPSDDLTEGEEELHSTSGGKGKNPKKPRVGIPHGPPKDAKLGPAYRVQPFTFMGYTQYFANLTYINGWVPKEKIGKQSVIDKKGKHDGDDHDDDDKHDKDSDKREPLQEFKFEIEYHTSDKPYKLKDMTVRNYMILANKVAQGVKKKIKTKEACEETLEFIDYDYGRGPLSLRSNSRITRYNPLAHPFTCPKEGVESATTPEKGKGGGKKKKGGNKKKNNKMWHTFYKRAVIGTIGEKELRKMDKKYWGEVHETD